MSPHVGRVCVRGDTDFSLTANFDRWSEEADFIFGYDAAQPGMRARAEALEEKAWKRLERRPRWSSRTGATRRRREDVKARIVRERGYVNKRLNCEDVAEFEYRRPSAGGRTGWWRCARTSAGVEPEELVRHDE